MTKEGQKHRFIINVEQLPEQYPTHLHEPIFWGNLGRAVATYGFLEEVLGKAIFALTATRQYDPSEIEAAYAEWLPKLERALSDPLGRLINAYANAARAHADFTTTNLDELIEDLKKASKLRNVLCHASWRSPDEEGASRPHFINTKMEIFDTSIDTEYLATVQKHVAELACSVISTISHMGLQFPGSNAPGRPMSG